MNQFEKGKKEKEGDKRGKEKGRENGGQGEKEINKESGELQKITTTSFYFRSSTSSLYR